MEIATVDNLYMNVRSSENILSEILQRANQEERDPVTDDSILNFYGLPEATLREVLSHEAAENKIRLLVDTIRGRPRNCQDDNQYDGQKRKDEEVISENFRKCCNVFGKEKHKMLPQSAIYLLEMGKLYMKYAIDGEGIHQKLNFIRSAALICGALTRFDIYDRRHVGLANSELENLHVAVISTASSSIAHKYQLLQFTKKVKTMLTEFRENVAVKLDKIVPLAKTTDEEKDHQQEWNKIKMVRDVCEYSTECYMKLLREMAANCQAIMGDPPCKFSVVGLGSLARREATLYSDFEHVIVLENHLSEQQKEYFRWFTTIFHIIVIGLCETVIPSVNVPSLCDLYSEKKSEKWFVDEVTPLGISFDGMMPHASKIPLGRPHSTKLKKHTVELIQPVETMVRFLTQEEELKNGYFLSDVLSKTTFVYGDQQLYDFFVQRSHDVMNQKTCQVIGKQQLQNILLNPNEAMQNPGTVHSLVYKNVKTTNYRPVTTLLSSIASLNRIKVQSSFEIVDELKQVEIIDEKTHRALMCCVAVTMEMRMQAYKVTGHQRRTLTHAEMADIGGKEGVIDCHITMAWLSTYAKTLAYKSLQGHRGGAVLSLPAKDSDYWKWQKLQIMQIFFSPEEYVKFGLRFTSDVFSQFENDQINASKAKSLLKGVFKGLVLSFGHLCCISHPDSEKWLWSCTVLLKLTGKNDYKLLEIYHRSMYTLYFLRSQFKECVEEFESWHVSYQNLPQHDKMPKWHTLSMYFWLVRGMSKSLDGSKMLERLNHLHGSETDFAAKSILKVGICNALLKLGSRSGAKEELTSLAIDIHKNAKQLRRSDYNALLSSIARTQMEHDFPIDALNTGKLLEDALDDELLASQGPLHSDSMLESKTGVFSTYYDLGMQEIFCSLSYRELISKVVESVKICNKSSPSKGPQLEKNGVFVRHVGCLMVFLENIRLRDVVLLVNGILQTPGKVKTSRALQPFFYACFADFLRPRYESLELQDAATNENFTLLKKLADGQNVIFNALFGLSAEKSECRLMMLATSHFMNFRFASCTVLLWRLLQWKKANAFMKRKSTELLITTVLAILVLQKRQHPKKYFTKIREISMVQAQYLHMVSVIKNRRFLAENIGHCILYRYFSNDRYIAVYNLAAVCLKFYRRRATKLLWLLVHAPNISGRMKYTSFAMFVQMSTVICGDRLAQNNFWQKAQGASRKSLNG